MAVLPFWGSQVCRQLFRRNRNNGVSTQRNREPIQALLPHTVIAGFASILILGLSTVPRRIVLDYGKQPTDKLRQLPHHPRGALPGLGESNNKLNRQMASPFLERLGLGNLQHGANDIHKLAAQKPRLGAGELDEKLESLLSGGLLAGIKRLGQSPHHRRQQVLEAVTIGGAGKALDEIDNGVKSGNSNVRVNGGIGEALEEDVVEVLDMRSEGIADKGGFLELRGFGGNALEHEREEFGPGVVGEDTGGEFGDGIAEFLGDGFGVLRLNRREKKRFEGRLRVWGEARPEVGVVARELFPEEDGRHGARLLMRRGMEEVRQLQREVIGIGLLAEVEERLRVGALLVGGGHQVRDQRLELQRIGAKDDRHLRLLHLGIHGG
ncbi:hypothetical protein CR513_32077, partial [Mucuna pruriens]